MRRFTSTIHAIAEAAHRGERARLCTQPQTPSQPRPTTKLQAPKAADDDNPARSQPDLAAHRATLNYRWLDRPR